MFFGSGSGCKLRKRFTALAETVAPPNSGLNQTTFLFRFLIYFFLCFSSTETYSLFLKIFSKFKPSITEKTSRKVVFFAKKYMQIPDVDFKFMKHCHKSVRISNNESCLKMKDFLCRHDWKLQRSGNVGVSRNLLLIITNGNYFSQTLRFVS